MNIENPCPFCGGEMSVCFETDEVFGFTYYWYSPDCGFKSSHLPYEVETIEVKNDQADSHD